MHFAQTLVNPSLTRSLKNHNKFKLLKNVVIPSNQATVWQMMSKKNNILAQTISKYQSTINVEVLSETIMSFYPKEVLLDHFVT